ncbi:hypothetical protein HGRIS_011029 [Hohenbuehelia grisea]|uniref:G domain-containing protein n=1 Tax=Hohenbuehelia grisea TaxID=104357 RepID=A0ABR3IYQ2_9AGAR
MQQVVLRADTISPAAAVRQLPEAHKRSQSLPEYGSQSRDPWSIESDFIPSPITQGDMIIAVMGPTGAGKSTFVNAATGRNSTEVGHSLESCTQDIRITRCQHPYDLERKVVFVDTPGFDDTRRTDVEVLTSITNWLAETYGQGITLSGLLFFHRISDNRFAGTPLRNLEMFKKLCGSSALRNVVLLTTMWDEVFGNTGEERLDDLQKNYWKGMIASGSRVARFDNRPDRNYRCAWDIIAAFSTVVQPPLLIQREMVDERRSLVDTSAGGVLFGWLENLMRQFRETLRRLETLLRGIPKDDAAAEDVKKQAVDAKLNMEEVSRQSRLLRANSQSLRRRAALVVRTVLAGGTKRPQIPRPIPELRIPETRPGTSSEDTDGVEDVGDRSKLAGLIVALRHARALAEMSSMPFIKGAFQLALTILESIEAMSVVDDALVTVASNASRLLLIIHRIDLGDISDDMMHCIADLESDLTSIQRVVDKVRSRAGVLRYALEPADRLAVQACEGKIQAAYTRFEVVSAIILHQNVNRLLRAGMAPETSRGLDPHDRSTIPGRTDDDVPTPVILPKPHRSPGYIAGYITNEPFNEPSQPSRSVACTKSSSVEAD